MPAVEYAVADGVATITLNRPEAMNSLDLASKERLLAAVTEASQDQAARAVVITGSGRAFCVGQDLKEHAAALRRSGGQSLSSTVEEHYNPIVHTLLTMAKPVVAAVNGTAAGAGASLAFACDFRVFAESASVNLAFAGVALSCDTASSWTLPRLVGRARALELLYFPRTIPARECADLGLATEVVADADFAGAVRDLADRLAAGPTVAYGAMRAAVTYSATHDLDGALANEGALMARAGDTEDHRNAVDAFLAKQRPEFSGR